MPRLELASLKESAVVELGLPVRDWVDGEDPYQLVAVALRGDDTAPVATAVTDSMPALHLLPLAKTLGALPVLATDVLRTLRMIKDAAEIDALLGDATRRQSLRTAGLEQIKKFTWEETARQTWNLYRRI